MADGPVRSAVLETAGSSYNAHVRCSNEIKDETMVRIRSYDQVVTGDISFAKLSEPAVFVDAILHGSGFPHKRKEKKRKEKERKGKKSTRAIAKCFSRLFTFLYGLRTIQ